MVMRASRVSLVVYCSSVFALGACSECFTCKTACKEVLPAVDVFVEQLLFLAEVLLKTYVHAWTMFLPLAYGGS
jgi:hypothetical protein